MTTPKLATNPPQGSGLVGQLVDAHYEALARGWETEQFAAACILKPVGHSSRTTKDGVHRAVTYEVVRLEPMRDAHDADQVTWLVTRAHDLRHEGSQMTLPVTNSPSEQRANLLVAIEEWATANDVDQETLNARWLDHFGGIEHASAAEIEKGSLANVLEFAGAVGAIEDPYANGKPSDPPFSDMDAPDGDDPTDAEDDPDGAE